jgi:hypothetical protein
MTWIRRNSYIGGKSLRSYTAEFEVCRNSAEGLKGPETSGERVVKDAVDLSTSQDNMQTPLWP